MNNIKRFIDQYGAVKLSWATKYTGYPYINFGDELSIFIHQKLFPNVAFHHSNFNENGLRIASIGTILHNFYDGETLVWGSGIDSRRINSRFSSSKFEIFGVRGKDTKATIESFGFKVPDVFGDPALFISRYYIKNPKPKYKIGIIPHCSNVIVTEKGTEIRTPCFNIQSDDVIVISPRTIDTVESVMEKIVDCEVILSESIHGCIVADALDIPNMFMGKNKFYTDRVLSAKDIKPLEHRYKDYTSTMDVNKFQLLHDADQPLDLEKIYSEIKSHYVPYDFSSHLTNLEENHPLNTK